MTAIGPTLETDRLILRPPCAADFEPWCAFMADEEAARHIGGLQAPSVVWRALCSVTGAWTISGFSMFSVIEKATGDWVGRLGPWQPEGWPGTEVGWGIIRDRWGKGYATEGSIAATDWAFDNFDWHEVVHTIDPANTASAAVARRLGSTILRQAQMPAPYEALTVDVWGQSREDWAARRASR
ncbi:GNAT family N-acetyltransferase [Phenylobacterium sp.]|uniref:GNAT family N-acetyltransferase n=1 Tax=Phenylobacterium sp. TaxID=1871053 RepID=UPI002734BBBD|nr:GNAT family N-acetyltransferase [Phenylobacterium sp.]MDP3632561.1 GNAT family N-acetyltransferase [Phenylobacterium sp.]MDP3866921.1 GNAT family N-acetyltransferase [Phenylobacterium sp.]